MADGADDSSKDGPDGGEPVLAVADFSGNPTKVERHLGPLAAVAAPTVVCISTGDADVDGLDALTVPDAGWRPLGLALMGLRALVAARRGDYAAVVSFSLFPHGCIALAAARLAGLPVHLGTIGADLDVHARAWYAPLVRALLRRFDVVTAPGSVHVRRLEAMGVDRAAVLRNPVDVERFAPPGGRDREVATDGSDDRKGRRNGVVPRDAVDPDGGTDPVADAGAKGEDAPAAGANGDARTVVAAVAPDDLAWDATDLNWAARMAARATPEVAHDEPATEGDDGAATEAEDGTATEDDDEPATDGDDEPAAEGDDEPATEGDDGAAAEGDDGTATEDDDEPAMEEDAATAAEGDDGTATDGDDETAAEAEDGMAAEGDEGAATEADVEPAAEGGNATATDGDDETATEEEDGAATEADVEPATDGDDDEQVDLLWVGRFSAEKDPLLFVRTVAVLRARGHPVSAAMVGDGPLAGAVRTDVERRDLCDAVALPGWVDDPAGWYRRARTFVLTSRRDALPLTLVEAMASGAVPVAPPVGNVGDAVVPEETGVLADRNPAALADAVAGLLADDERRERLARAAAAAGAAYSMDAAAEDWERVLAALGVRDGGGTG